MVVVAVALIASTEAVRTTQLDAIVAGGLGVGGSTGTGGKFKVPKNSKDRMAFVKNLMKNLKQGKDANGKATKAPRDHTGTG